jgi:hypothetical protein
MDEFKDLTVCVVDNGLFLGIAKQIAPAFKTVYYTTPTAGPFPSTGEYSIGSNIPGIKRLPDPNDALALYSEIDLWIFPDLYFAGMQEHLRSIGAAVWGSGPAEIYELDRLAFKKKAKDLGLNIGPYEVVKSMEDVVAFVKKNPGWFLKTSRHAPPGRGDFETLKVSSFEECEYRLRDIASKLGHRAKTTEFILEQPIEADTELAIDTYNVWGQFPQTCVLGAEAKAESYIGKVIPYSKAPPALIDVNEAMVPVFKKSLYSNMSAIECRMTEGKAFVIDPCFRYGRPPLSIILGIKNWPEIFYYGALGEIVEPEFEDKFFAEMCIYCDYGMNSPAPIFWENSYSFGGCVLSNVAGGSGGGMVGVPQVPGVSGMGSVVAWGSTASQAIERVRELGRTVKGYDVKVTDALDNALKSLESGSKYS